MKDSQDPSRKLFFLQALLRPLTQCFQLRKAKSKLEDAMELHDEIYGEGSETIILSDLMLRLGLLYLQLEEISSAIETLQRVEQMQKRITRCTDLNVINLNIHMAFSYSRLCQNDRALDCLEKALCLSHKIFGEHNISSELLKLYGNAANVYAQCARFDEALSLQKRSLKLAESLYGDTPHPGRIVEIEENWQ